ncbi:MAG TPA: hypothetical protein VLB44_15600, partial [Kofleriaceae bacterium]|nr:hypothetical protein [Kofleriaceae bacterium]
DPGQEITVCKNFAVPDGAFDIGRFEHAMTDVSHHLLVYPLSIPAADVTNDLILNCDENPANQMTRAGFMYGTQSPTGDLKLPAGIAYPTRGGLSIQLEYHVFNATDEAVDAEAALNLWRQKGDITGEAGMIFLYHNQIAIPPMTRSTARQRFSYSQDFKLLMLVPHMHSRGVAMQAFRDSGTGTPQTLFDVQGWENPTVMFDPPVTFNAGDVLDYHCDYDNQTSDYVFDGFSARHDEMCVTGGIYYRPGGDRLPLGDEIVWGRGVVYTGTNSCAQVDACSRAIDFSSWTTTPNPDQQFQVCLNSGCQAGGTAYHTLENCRWNNCRADCYVTAADDMPDGITFDSTACQACMDTHCAALRDACPTATCP